MEVLPQLFKLWSWVDLDPFYAKVKFGHIGFCKGKSENYLFLAHLSRRLRGSLQYRQASSSVRRTSSVHNFKQLLLWNYLANCNQISYTAPRAFRNEKLYKWSGSHDQHGENFKKSSSPEPIDRWSWNLICSIVYGSPTKVVQIMTLGWPWSILREGQIWSHRLLYGKNWKLFISWKLLQPWISKLLEAFS